MEVDQTTKTKFK